MVKEWILNLSASEILILFFLMGMIFYGLKKVEDKKKEK